MRETQDLVTIIPWTFIAQICNLFIQCWLIKKFLFKPVCAIIEKRRALADSQIQDAKKAKEEAEAKTMATSLHRTVSWDLPEHF